MIHREINGKFLKKNSKTGQLALSGFLILFYLIINMRNLSNSDIYLYYSI